MAVTPSWKASQQYNLTKYAPTWKKEAALRKMPLQDSRTIASKDTSLPLSVKKKFVK